MRRGAARAAAATSAAAATGLPVFPSEPIWTIDISARPVRRPSGRATLLFVALESGISARRLADGTELWSASIVAEGAMAATAERVIVASKGEVRGLTAATGQVAWTEQVGPLTAPPVTHGDALILATGEQLSAHRLADGSRPGRASVGVVDQRPSVERRRLLRTGQRRQAHRARSRVRRAGLGKRRRHRPDRAARGWRPRVLRQRGEEVLQRPR